MNRPGTRCMTPPACLLFAWLCVDVNNRPGRGGSMSTNTVCSVVLWPPDRPEPGRGSKLLSLHLHLPPALCPPPPPPLLSLFMPACASTPRRVCYSSACVTPPRTEAAGHILTRLLCRTCSSVRSFRIPQWHISHISFYFMVGGEGKVWKRSVWIPAAVQPSFSSSWCRMRTISEFWAEEEASLSFGQFAVES